MSLILLFNGPLAAVVEPPAPPVSTGFAHADVSIAPPNVTAVAEPAAVVGVAGRTRRTRVS